LIIALNGCGCIGFTQHVKAKAFKLRRNYFSDTIIIFDHHNCAIA